MEKCGNPLSIFTSLLINGLLACAITAQAADTEPRVDLCAFAALQSQAPAILKRYVEVTYDNAGFKLPGKMVMLRDKVTLFRCDSFLFTQRPDADTYTQDNVLISTAPDGKSIRFVEINIKGEKELAVFKDALLKAYGAGAVLYSSVKTQGALKKGREVRRIALPNTNAVIYMHTDLIPLGRKTFESTSVVVASAADKQLEAKILRPDL